MSGQVVWRCTDQQTLAAQFSSHYVPIVLQGSDSHHEIDAIVDDIHQPLTEADRQIELLVSNRHIDQGRQDVTSAKGRRQINPQATDGFLLSCSQQALGFSQFVHHPQAARQVGFSFLSERQTAGCTMQQLDPQSRFQAAHAFSHCGAGHAKFKPGGCKTE